MKGHVYLVGMPGSGKSSVGRALAALLDRQFIDVDEGIEHGSEMSIAEIFRDHGEEEFRDREESALHRIARTTAPAVVACGGGIVLRESNRRMLRETGVVVYLDVPLDLLRHRVVVGASSRPLLQEPQDIDRLFAEREPLYREVAHHRLDADRDPRTVADAIMEALA